jgi:CubicO group peptidase (beta-lactamase class C family)
MQERVFDPLGIENLAWDTLGIDDGWVGRHTNPFSGIHISARELARFGYLMLRGGAWKGRGIVPPWWLELATRSSQSANPGYGLTWWANTQGALWEAVPHDAFAAMGYNTNLCCVIPSHDLVIVRIGAGPTQSTEVIAAPFLAAVAAAVMAD